MTEILPPGLENALAAYRENQFDVFDWGESYNAKTCYIRFHGDYPDEGFRAAALALERGFPIRMLSLQWNYGSHLHHADYDEHLGVWIAPSHSPEERPRSTWMLTFLF